MTNKKAISEKNILGKSIFGKTTGIDLFLMTVLLVIGLTEVIHLVAVVMGKSLSFCAGLFVVGLILVIAFMGGVAWFSIGRKKGKQGAKNIGDRKDGKAAKEKATKIPLLPGFVMGLLMLLQLVAVLGGESVYVEGDMTLETVQSFLAMDGIYQVNPLTGAAFEAGMPFRLKILCLPTLYSILCYLLPVSPQYLVYHLVPVFVLVCSYLVYWQLAGLLFEKETETGKINCGVKKSCFMILVVLLFFVGSYAYGMDGFGALYCGYRGVAVRALILLPYTVCLALRKKWLMTGVCVLAEACIVWTLYGMGACLLVALSLFVISGFMRWQRGKEGAEC